MDILTSTSTDLNPPRHAIESDDEDEFNPLHHDHKSTKVDIKFIGDLRTRQNLIVAKGDPGAFWAKGAGLGEQIGAFTVNGVQTGLVFSPSWATINVVISEAFSQLPVWAMHPYAQAILDALKPTSVVLLDEYSVPSYICSSPISVSDAPIRYLSTTTLDAKNQAQPFTPPNLLNATSASLLSIASIAGTPGTLLLLPSPNIIKAPPRSIESNNFTHLNQDVIGWPLQMMLLGHELLLRIIGVSGRQQWKSVDGLLASAPKPGTSASRRSEIGEGGMYI